MSRITDNITRTAGLGRRACGCTYHTTADIAALWTGRSESRSTWVNPLDRERLDRFESVSGLAAAGVACHKEGIVNALEKHCSARIDGVLRVVADFPAILAEPLLYGIQVMSGLETGPCREPKDSHIGYNLVPGQPVEFRVSILPSIFGEKVVLRVLRRSTKKVPISEIGFAPDDLAYVHKVVHAPNGLALVTGPTGSGKTSTLYAVLDEINEVGVNIVTAEDPVERVVGGTTQVNCSAESGVTFAAALKSFLRQDPDIVMVGEIRDPETCDIALKAALTGHLVLSTKNTNDAPSAVLWLLNMGMEPFTVAAALRMIIAQRLVRKFCRSCVGVVPVPEDVRAELEAAGLRALRYRGLQFVAAGITSLGEVHRHTIEQ